MSGAGEGFLHQQKEYQVGSTRNNFDWNKVKIWNADGDDIPLTGDKWIEADPKNGIPEMPSLGFDFRLCNDVKEVAVLTGNLERALTDWMSNAEFVFCCFAWLTNYRVLDALASLEHGCQVVVQKEDFLRPDSDHAPHSYATLRRKYEKLRCGFSRGYLPSIASDLSTCSGDDVEAVRCAGVANTDRRRASPRMHHKFAVACTCTVSEYQDSFGNDLLAVEFHPYSVWTGSFNPTSNGTRSRENAVVIESCCAANYYINEWAKVFAVSEPLDWSSEWSSPEWRIGT